MVNSEINYELVFIYFFKVYRTTPVEHSFDFSNQLPNIKLPIVKAGICQLSFTFHEAIPDQDLQTLYVLAVRPSIISIDKDRRVKTSYHTN